MQKAFIITPWVLHVLRSGRWSGRWGGAGDSENLRETPGAFDELCCSVCAAGRRGFIVTICDAAEKFTQREIHNENWAFLTMKIHPKRNSGGGTRKNGPLRAEEGISERTPAWCSRRGAALVRCFGEVFRSRAPRDAVRPIGGPQNLQASRGQGPSLPRARTARRTAKFLACCVPRSPGRSALNFLNS